MEKGNKIFYTHFDPWYRNPKDFPGDVVEFPPKGILMKIKVNFSDFWNKVNDTEVWVLKGSCRLQEK